MKKYFSIIFISLLLTGCYSNQSTEVDIPEEDPPIGFDTMSDILVDMHLAQSSIKQMQVKRKDIEGKAELYHSLIFKKHGVSKEDFELSMEYYNYRSEELKLLYEEVITKLSLMDSEIKSLQKDTVQ